MYTGNIDKDLNSILVDIVAETVAAEILTPLNRLDETEKLAKLIANRLRITYHVNRRFGAGLEKIEHTKQGSRDKVRAWMKRWSKAWVLNEAFKNLVA